jgi:aspartate racemase
LFREQVRVDSMLEHVRREYGLDSMKKGRCLGLVGGLGVGATIHYYRSLAKAHAARGLALDLVMAHAETELIFEFVRAGDRVGLARYLAGFADRLKAAGADFMAIPAVTPHFCEAELAGMSALPILSIFEPLQKEIVSRKTKRVAVLGTRFVIESQLFGRLSGVEFSHPLPDEVEFIHQTYTELAQRGKGSEEQWLGLTRIARTLRRRDQVDAIVMAGTDLTLIFNEANTEFPHIDCAALHIQYILEAMTG